MKCMRDTRVIWPNGPDRILVLGKTTSAPTFKKKVWAIVPSVRSYYSTAVVKTNRNISNRITNTNHCNKNLFESVQIQITDHKVLNCDLANTNHDSVYHNSQFFMRNIIYVFLLG